MERAPLQIGANSKPHAKSALARSASPAANVSDQDAPVRTLPCQSSPLPIQASEATPSSLRCASKRTRGRSRNVAAALALFKACVPADRIVCPIHFRMAIMSPGSNSLTNSGSRTNRDNVMPFKPPSFTYWPVKSACPGMVVPEIPLAFSLGPQLPAAPGPVPVPYPSFSSVSLPLGCSSKVIVSEAKAHGFSKEGAEQIFLHRKVPKALPDVLVLSRFSQNPGPDGSFIAPSMSKVVISTIEEMDQNPTDSPVPSCSLAPSSTPAPSSTSTPTTTTGPDA